MDVKMRTSLRATIDFLLFPLRAVCLIENDCCTISSLASERFYYVATEIKGYCLDVGCGKRNRFIVEFLKGRGKGIDVFKYEGLTDEEIVEDISRFPFENASFGTVTFIANINHIPRSMRDVELKEAYRCLKSDGKIIVTMGNPIPEILTHKLVAFYDKCFGTNLDMDGKRGMGDEEEYYLSDREIVSRLKKAGFTNIRKKHFLTQWLLNHMFIGEKTCLPPVEPIRRA